MVVGEIRLFGVPELQRAFAEMNRQVQRELKIELRALAEPVRADAARLAAANIGRIGPQWSRMRVGITTRVVYVAPLQRRHGGSPRPNLAPLLMDRAMQLALDRHKGQIVEGLDALLSRAGIEHGF